ncbi:hypothetical protein HAHE_05880 [Haloferula helveola]|uniref:TIGR02206 family membrane protein n=1 Tax=Haloferula helveola TaxID=490095 RepID=A0ABM7RBD1_9BACT|nr:hypothetical protein HAHE_05880 [Haloferula helveola]
MPEPPFAPFTSQHGMTVMIGAAAMAVFVILGRRGGQCERITRTVLAFLNLTAVGFGSWAWSHVQRETDIDNVVPLHLCDLAAILAGFALITRNRTLAMLTYFWGLAGTVQGVATPAIDIGWPHPAFLSFFIHHFAVITAAFYLPLVLGWRIEIPWWKSPLKAFGWLNLYVVVAVAVNAMLDTNFGFLARKPINPSLLDHLGPHPMYIFWLELIAMLLFLLLALPVRDRKTAL